MTLPIEHLSASSINLFMRCPRQWQNKYVLGIREPSNSSLIIGSAFHLSISRLYQGIAPGDAFGETVEDLESKPPGHIVWKDSPEKSRDIATAMVYHYWETVGKWMDGVTTEQEFSLDIPGVDVPVVGFVDAETEDRIVDMKTNGSYTLKQALWFLKKPNPEWKFQMGVYQLFINKPAEVHVITRASESPVVLPDTAPALSFGLLDSGKVEQQIRFVWDAIQYNWRAYGKSQVWPGNPNHEWAGKYCPMGENCCAL